MTRAAELAKRAVDNIWLTLAQRVVTLFLVPLIGAAFDLTPEQIDAGWVEAAAL
ncbi:hypothetical protein [Roseococcus sp.]|uniref:hypothetical protein n=1 Tax=Roseococcus sp. TaxID=2109646 RepID=UPI003BA8752D